MRKTINLSHARSPPVAAKDQPLLGSFAVRIVVSVDEGRITFDKGGIPQEREIYVL
jgi:hypothetical protein